MKTALRLLCTATALLGLVPVLSAAELGDAAPPLKISEWIKGKPVTLAQGKGNKIFVVEFWATWCPPCRTSIPHLTELQKKFKGKGVVFVGISDEKADKVKKFVTDLGAKMDYVVALDDGGQTSDGYMKAFGAEGIPHAFIVDKQGRFAWQGHPMVGLEEALQAMVDGKFDLAKERKRGGAQKKLEQFAELVQEGTDPVAIEKLGQELEALDQELGGIMPGEKFSAAAVRKQVKFQKLLVDYQHLLAGGQGGEKAEAMAKELKAAAPKDFNLDDFTEQMQLSPLLDEYMQAVSGTGDAAKAKELGQKLAATKVKNPQILNQVAWAILTEESIKQRDLPLALTLAKAANDASLGKDAAVLDTYARALFDNGKVADAIAEQKKALALATDAELRKELAANLKTYEAKAAKK